jgi:hypothetical protein
LAQNHKSGGSKATKGWAGNQSTIFAMRATVSRSPNGSFAGSAKPANSRRELDELLWLKALIPIIYDDLCDTRHHNEALLAYERTRTARAWAAVLGSRERARENHLASRWARFKRGVKFALRKRFGRDKTAFQTAWLYGYDVGRELR